MKTPESRFWRSLRLALTSVLLGGVITAPSVLAAASSHSDPTFTVADSNLPTPLVIDAVGDTQFGDAMNAESAKIHATLIARIATDRPVGLIIGGNLVAAGSDAAYGAFFAQTAAWRDANIRLLPALGETELQDCAERSCLDLWWKAFPELRGHRWYSIGLGDRALVVVLDSTSSLRARSAQRTWFEGQMRNPAGKVHYVVIVLHHPPVADEETRANEQELVKYLDSMPVAVRHSILVFSGHVHDYERFNPSGTYYVVSGGGGAKPDKHDYQVRKDADLYDRFDFPNYNYLRITFKPEAAIGEMLHLSDVAVDQPGDWRVLDRFRLNPTP